MHSSLPQQLINFHFTRSRVIIELFKWLEDSSLRAADAIITICPGLFEYVNGVIQDKDKQFLIENSIYEPIRLKKTDVASGEGKKADELTQELIDLLRDRKLVVYAGTLEHYQGIGLLLEAFEMVVSKVPEALLLVLGGNLAQVAHYRSVAAEIGLSEKYCRFTGRVPKSLVSNVVQHAAVLVSPRTEGTNTPLKIYEQLDSGKPLVATNIYSHTQVLMESVAFLVEPQPEEFAKGILEALSSEVESEKKSANAKCLYAEKYSRKNYVNKMSQLLSVLS
jgi:glycosyltransferase involved in cell wall biosynthesis